MAHGDARAAPVPRGGPTHYEERRYICEKQATERYSAPREALGLEPPRASEAIPYSFSGFAVLSELEKLQICTCTIFHNMA